MSVDEETLKILESEASKCRIPNENSMVEKDECMLSFDTPFSPQGLYTNLSTWKSYGRDYVTIDSNKTGQKLYLYQKKYNLIKPQKDESELLKDKQESEPTKLGIGIDGGFSGFESDYEIKTENMLCILPNFNLIELNNNKIPLNILNCINSIIACKSISAHEEIKSWQNELRESKHSETLIQLDLDQSIRPSPNQKDWKCMALNCGKTENLWFNLSDGYIGCGRRHWDGTGGCGAAAQHYKDTGSTYHLAVKLGTITPKGGDVWSYSEDDMVLNKNLSTHLAHFGIDIMKQEKYDKSVEEMEISANKNYIFGEIIESGKKLEHVCQPELIGLVNLGNSCYMNSILQAIISINEIKNKYFKNSNNILNNACENPNDDFIIQFTKLIIGLCTNRYIKQRDNNKELNMNYAKQIYGNDYIPKKAYSGNNNNNTDAKEEKDEKLDSEGISCVSIKPRMIKRLIGRGHEEFSTNRQQDAVEYFRHFVEFMNRKERVATNIDKNIFGLKTLFKMKIEERLQCLQTNKVRYSNTEDIILRVDVDLNLATNINEVEKYKQEELKNNKDNKNENKKDENKILPIIPLEKLIDGYLCDQIINDWMSPATNKKGSVQKTVRLLTFPNYLAIQIQRYYINESWIPQKHECIIPVPQILDLTRCKGKGLQSNEQELPKGNSGSGGNVNVQKMEADANIVSTLMMLGLAQTDNAAKRAALAVQNANADMAAAWLMEHMTDSNINDPIVDDSGGGNNNDGGGDNSGGGGGGGYEPDINKINELSMISGFSKEYAKIALQQTNGDQARAADWLFSRENIDNDIAQIKNDINAKKNEKNNFTDGNGIYELMCIVSHLGTATSHGHYVAHIKKNNNWYFFNDSKVAISQDPPFNHGYLYIFKRK